jgi:hypothetical protein
LKEQRILCKETRERVIRIAPPLAITRKEIGWAMDRIRKVLIYRHRTIRFTGAAPLLLKGAGFDFSWSFLARDRLLRRSDLWLFFWL